MQIFLRELDSLDQPSSLSGGNSRFIFFLGLFFLLHLPDVHLTFNFPVRHQDGEQNGAN